MRLTKKIIFGGLCAGLLAGCTGHRYDTPPTPDGDTIEVVVKKPQVSEQPDTPELSEQPD